MPDDGFLPPHGNYSELLSFQKAEIIYDLTFRFAHKYLSKGDRTIDQMIQSARSGKKNILEGSKAALTSKETEIKLTNVARASLEELLDDYRDYLRARDLPIWDKDSKEAQYVRRLGRKPSQTYEDYREFVETRPPEVVANIALCLINQANYLLDQQIRRLEKDFIMEGGLRERHDPSPLAAAEQTSGVMSPIRPIRPIGPMSSIPATNALPHEGSPSRLQWLVHRRDTYVLPPLSREERASKAKAEISTHFHSKQQVFLDFVLSHYVSVGVEELDQAKLTPLLRLKYHNSINDSVADLGSDIGATFVGFQKYLYDVA